MSPRTLSKGIIEEYRLLIVDKQTSFVTINKAALLVFVFPMIHIILYLYIINTLIFQHLHLFSSLEILSISNKLHQFLF